MNAPAQLDFGFDRPLRAETVEKVPAKKSDSFSVRCSYYAPIEVRERKDRFLSWQDEYAWEVGIPRSGPI